LPPDTLRFNIIGFIILYNIKRLLIIPIEVPIEVPAYPESETHICLIFWLFVKSRQETIDIYVMFYGERSHNNLWVWGGDRSLSCYFLLLFMFLSRLKWIYRVIFERLIWSFSMRYIRRNLLINIYITT